MTNIKLEIVQELYRTLTLLGAESDLLGTVGSWGTSLPDDDVLANLKHWNQETVNDLKARIEHYEMSSRRPAYIQGEGQQISAEERLAS